jgi:hypothetical protein
MNNVEVVYLYIDYMTDRPGDFKIMCKTKNYSKLKYVVLGFHCIHITFIMKQEVPTYRCLFTCTSTMYRKKFPNLLSASTAWTATSWSGVSATSNEVAGGTDRVGQGPLSASISDTAS